VVVTYFEVITQCLSGDIIIIIIIIIIIVVYTALLLGLSHFFSFLILYTIDKTPWAGDQPVTRFLHIYRTTETE
jgi:hypothetical protein